MRDLFPLPRQPRHPQAIEATSPKNQTSYPNQSKPLVNWFQLVPFGAAAGSARYSEVRGSTSIRTPATAVYAKVLALPALSPVYHYSIDPRV